MADYDWLQLGATALGGLLGGSSASSGGGTSQTATKEPWADAAPWLRNQIAQGQQLQNHYQQNPFNAQQQTAYGNTFADLDNFRGNVAPGLMQFANNAMTGSYQRQSVTRPGAGAGYNPNAAGNQAGNQTPGGRMGGNDASIDGLYKKYLGRSPEEAGAQYWQGQFGDSIDANEVAMFRQAAQPEIQRNGIPQGPFGMAPGAGYGQPNFAASNPFTNGTIQPPAPAAPGGLLGAASGQAPTQDGRGDGGPSAAAAAGSLGGLLGSMGGFGGFGDSTLNASNSTKGEGMSKGAQSALSAALGMMGLGPLGGLVAAGIDTAMSQGSYNGYGGLDGTTTEATGPGTIGSRDSYGSNESNPGYGGGAGMGDSDGGFGGTEGSGNDGGNGDGMGSSSDSDSGWAKGGKVTKDRLRGADPAGPDDGYGALDAGEFVIRQSAVKKYGPDVMRAINAGRIPPAALAALAKQHKGK